MKCGRGLSRWGWQTNEWQRGWWSAMSLCTNWVIILSSNSAVSWAEQAKQEQVWVEWVICLRGGTLSQVQSASSGRDMQACFCVSALGFHTLTSTHTHALTHCQCVNLDPVRQFIISHRYKNPLLTNKCSARTADAGGDNAKSPCLTNVGRAPPPPQAVNPTGPSHLCCSLSDPSALG